MSLGGLYLALEGPPRSTPQPIHRGPGGEQGNQRQGDQGKQYKRDPELGTNGQARKQFVEIDHRVSLGLAIRSSDTPGDEEVAKEF